ncbi:MAG: HDOD domain-containing protein [Gammaproteobacteria bacterium]|nr:HDOD domain-containing protein [Gammaproteobacteria bacterium]
MFTAKVQRFLDELYIKYDLHTNVKVSSTLQFSQFAKTVGAHAVKVVLFSDKRGPLLVAFDAKDGLDFERLSQASGRSLGLDSGYNYKFQLEGFSIRHLPPFGRLFQMPMLVDENLLLHKKYLLEINKGDSFIEVDSRSFKTLIKHATVKSFTRSLEEKKQKASVSTLAASAKKPAIKKFQPLLSEAVLEKQFKQGANLPVMPSVAKRLLELRAQETLDIDELIFIIKSDPVITAKLISYAQSPYFSYQGKLDTLHEAIFHVLGVDLTVNTALALSVGNEFKGPMDGPMGGTMLWRHAVYSAVLSQSIATTLSERFEIKPSEAYLFALLQNIGFLALGHMFTKRYQLFNKAVIAKPSIAVETIEKRLLGISHVKVGSMLMDAWHMPEPYKLIISNHHNFDYRGNKEIYIHVINLANALLKAMDIGDARDSAIPEDILKKYRINEVEIENMLEMVMSWHDNLNHLAYQLAA